LDQWHCQSAGPDRGIEGFIAVSDRLSVTFWGTRGSVPCPGPSTVRYGGNTTCFEITCGDAMFVIDGGSGLIGLGKKIAREGIKTVDIFFTHTHWDHVCGIPFFGPAYMPDVEIRFHAGHLGPEKGLRDVLCDQMIAPLFPVPLSIFNDCHYTHFAVGDVLEPLPGVRMATRPLNHPNGASGYRIEWGGKVIAIITDTEHHRGRLDPEVLALSDGADIMVYDAMFTDEQYQRHVGWGHSTWQEALRVGDAAGVDRVVLFHHNPDHDDDQMADIERAAAAERPGTIAAREGDELIA
jgi:phosphoribosyl 1,2-cyclic phosphodiesterase